MRFDHMPDIHHHLAQCIENSGNLLGGAYGRAVEGLYNWYTQSLFAGDVDLRPIPSFLALNAFSLWVASVEMAASGHAVATYPLFRGSLELASCSLVTERDETKEAIWRDRDASRVATRECRQALATAPEHAAQIMNSIQAGSGEIVKAAYELAIDWGADANEKSVFRYVQPQSDADEDDWHLNLNVLSRSHDFEVLRSCIGSLEYAFVIGTILIRTIGNVPKQQVNALHRLHQEKETLVADWFGDIPI